MSALGRSDDSVLARWWWTVDRWMLVMVFALMGAGLILTWAAGPWVARTIGLEPLHFVKRQGVFLVLAAVVMLAVSLVSPRQIRRAACVLLPVSLLLMLVTVLAAPEINGSQRWLPLGSFTLQPSELFKPSFVVFAGWMLSAKIDNPNLPSWRAAAAVYIAGAALLVLQPDFGQLVLVTLVFLGQLTLAGLPFLWISALAVAGIAGLGLAYLTVPHVASRIDRFIDPSSGDTLQMDRALEAFRRGGLLGQGPGEGEVKRHLPDAHTDYIFAVAGEEFGTLAALALLAAFAVIVVRALSDLLDEEDPFIVIAGAGLVMLFGLQALINTAVNLALLPPKGMTLPFISYGGSSLLTLALTMGMVLALTRRNRYLTAPLRERRA
ncbi:cell division protein FtsW [Rhodothalassium salexigens DSM 2132]|uniref:Probable peptidoglycan glycosyltransferase FtsW n=1 Tax=Rhodothalassium salexigens DSM 2132 TaxID=1188247 RepID=A0A4R2PBV0_RHOSA|nr:putative peptidoglycan glycosyltransferase FtsW [Rhodothalassium salexigens]MBB4212239.1 cell division protein FtsW [Rhodothalassium salexigens DSM 2132]MBK1639027.1 cell division protein FtsW [Rhodothalassium salexigens DSM 2132]TCP32610.1 cell division protein FtsW [Rhodothalassium salexigens DSM 2132]